MDFFKGVWEFVSNQEVVVAFLAVLGGLKVMARFTKWSWDDKVLSVLEWPFRKLLKR